MSAMVSAAVRKKRPCAECRRWFLPDARAGDRQRTCGSAVCQQARRQRTHREWRAQNRDYDRDRRWRLAIDAARADPTSGPPGPHPPPPMSGVPWDVVQTEMQIEGRVILAQIVQIITAFVKAEIQRQVRESPAGAAKQSPTTNQTEIDEVP